MTHRLRIARVAAHLYNAVFEASHLLPEKTRRALLPVLVAAGIRIHEAQTDARREEIMREHARTHASDLN